MHVKVLDIPELAALLVRYLHPQDLLRCVQVNLYWNSLFIPFLWHTIDDSTPSWDTILQSCAGPNTTHSYYFKIDPARVRESDKDKDQEWVRAVFRKYGRFIRVLSIHCPLVLEAVSLSIGGGGSSSGDGCGCEALESLTMACRNAAQRSREQHPRWIDAASNRGEVIEAKESKPLFPDYIIKDDFTPPTQSYCTTNQEAMEYGWNLTQHYWHTILKNRRTLKRFVMKRVPGIQWRVRSKDIYIKMITKLKGLQELRGDISGDWATDDLWNIPKACPRMEVLSLSMGDHRRFAESLPETIVSTSLRTLLLRTVNVSVNGLLNLLSLLPNLSNLLLQSVGSSPSKSDRIYWGSPPLLVQDDLLPIARDLLPSIIGSSLKSLDALLNDYDQVLSCLPNLAKLVQEEQFDETLAMALTTHCPRFEELRELTTPWYIDESQRPPADPTNKFLVDNACLRVFDSIRHFVKVDEMLRQPWACLGLEWLSCRIVGVDRLNEEEEAMVDQVKVIRARAGETDPQFVEEVTAAVEKSQRCQRQHYGVYDQLARLTRLKHLDLGYESRYPCSYKDDMPYVKDGQEYFTYSDGKTFDTLEFSLESGLDRLRALKDLEMIGFECLNHRIGRKELEWMAKNWPRLNLMYGLDNERLYMIEQNEERAALKAYFQQLRPDVVHDCLFEDNIY
ncbi:MAG: hypothetical protein J3R72DRAFT_494001 [Linnemannia gamsii]|nr:MAG: hypothetical protein J3R72DRAFT_494001 [Linnemannia gamsii]